MTAHRWFAKNSGKSANFMNFKTTSHQFLFDWKGMTTTGSVRWTLVMMICGDDWPRSVNDDHLTVIMYTVSWADKWPKTYNSTAENTQTNTHRYLHIQHTCTFTQRPRSHVKQKRCLAVNHVTYYSRQRTVRSLSEMWRRQVREQTEGQVQENYTPRRQL